VTSTFASLLQPLVPPVAGPASEAILPGAPLVHLDYADELEIKRDGLRCFWRAYRLPGEPGPVTASPRPRGYRTTSKRKTLVRGDTLHLVFGERLPRSGPVFRPSRLEPPEHAQIYRFLQEKLSQPAFRLTARHLNYLIIRGSYAKRAVIFNIDTLNGPLVRKLKLLADHLQQQPEPVAAAFVYHDPSRSDYYLESRRPDEALQMKKLFGPAWLAVEFGGCRYRFHPTSFSQINESMAPVMLNLARDLLDPAPHESLLDLYCGYGLFSHFLAPGYGQVVGIDAAGASIRAATHNSRLNVGGSHCTFLARPITGDLMANLRPAATARESVLLDPPRQGPREGVIAALAQRRPRAALHIFCGIDHIPAALAQWQAHGYEVRRIVPLDMFPGTAHLETLVLLRPRSSAAEHHHRASPG
jgi:tRNA/tmRNA/rRNA uracil-C5-methylase (TrmA/RlmC/RlmD family)